ncbi:tannase/feruloyl esterase family alpha/beta hydrolase [Ramlibacter albus]|uniref:Tannase/feruloyl esterase family alpha/beta hydrolase n=1 Tax=Ramlibacter albus TaxID=2079448 RepID=A0A923MAP0_9BURK|nr:tannase/feruloyl esterase family alpha/beta hydrolase [Ramlibacter albus]MBC5765849.1 tannase/feruloyl esterase family alpha/beta hydrolase [Ramlibacter albus]
MKRAALLCPFVLAACASPATETPAACEALARVVTEAGTVTSATLVRPPTKIGNVDVAAKFCRVQGVARPSSDSEIRFEVWLPETAQAWSGRFKLNGTGGYNGAVPYARLAQDIEDGWVTAGSNMGHDGNESAAWTLNHPEKVKDWGLRSHYYVATAAKALANSYYGQPVRYAYFEGCSNGGRQGMMLAQRYPQLFDGIATGAPSHFYPEILMWLAWSGKLQTPVAGRPAVLPPAKQQLLDRASHAACDAQDGLADGQITNPRTCRFTPDALRCTGADGPGCLTDAQLAVAQGMYAGMRTSRGVLRYAGVQPGSEALWDPAFADDHRYGPFIGHYVYSKTSPPYNWRRDLAWDEEFDHIKAFLTPVTAAPSPDLGAFKARGGKMIQFHGWSDPIVPPTGSIAYYNALIQFERLKSRTQRQVDEAVDNLTPQQVTADSLALGGSIAGYHRLFLLPEVGHCGGGTGPGAVGGGFPEPAKAQRTAQNHAVGALMRWVEQGVAPEAIVATKYNDAGTITRQRPICAYPKVAVYNGSGDVDSAASFSCAMQTPQQTPTAPIDIHMIQNSLRQRAVLGPTR